MQSRLRIHTLLQELLRPDRKMATHDVNGTNADRLAQSSGLNPVARAVRGGPDASRTTSLYEGHNVFADSFFVFFAAWTVVAQISLFAGLSFRQSWMIAWPLASLAAAVFWRQADRAPRFRTAGASPSPATRTWVWPAAAVAVLLVFSIHRPDADDQCYLGLAAIALDHALSPIAALEQWSSCPRGYALTSFEFIRASFSWLTGTPILISYYLVWPGLIAVLIVTVTCDVIKSAGVRNMALAWLVFFVVMLAWGDGHRTPSNFGLARMFHGKSALFWAVIPAAICHWLRYVDTASRKSLFMLHCTIVAGTGLSPTGVPMGVLLCGLFFLATLLHRGLATQHRTALIALAICAIYPAALGIVMRMRYMYFSSVAAVDAGPQWVVMTSDMVGIVVGSGLRGAIAVLCAAALPLLLAPGPNRRPLSVYSGICTILLVLPWTSSILGIYSVNSFSWRWLFAIPFVPSIIVAADFLVHRYQVRHLGAIALCLLALVYVSSSTRWVISRENYASLSWPGFKLPDSNGIFLRPYGAFVRRDGLWLISPETGTRL